jgi:hypothetical protein
MAGVVALVEKTDEKNSILELVDIRAVARELCETCGRREEETCNVDCRISGENKCCAYCDRLTGICLCEYLRKQRHFKERDYFRRVERFLFSIAPTKVALEDLCLELKEVVNTFKITGQTDGVYVTGGVVSSKQEKYVARVEYLKAEILKRETLLKRFEMVMEQIGKENNGNGLRNLVKWKYLDGHENSVVWRMLNIERPTFYRWRNQVIDLVFKCLPSQFFEQG